MPALSAPVRLFLGRYAAFLLLALLVAACDNPFSEDGGKPAAANPDSLDAELGKNQLNRYDFLQGKFLPTGQTMDLAIEGKGLFILKNQGDFVYFRRPAMFTQDAEGYLHLGNTRTRLQGVRLYSDSNPWPRLPSGSSLRASLQDLMDVRWPFDDLAPPRATTKVKLGRNLDSDSYGKGSILVTQAFLHHAEPADLLICLMGHDGRSLGINAGDILTLSAILDETTVAVDFAVTGKSTLAELAAAMTTFLRTKAIGGLTVTVDAVSAADHAGLRGALTLYGNAFPIRNFRVSSNRPITGPEVTHALALPAEIPAGTSRLAMVTNALRAPALENDPLAEVYDAEGNGFGLEPGDAISISGTIGDERAQNVDPLIHSTSLTLGALMEKVRETFQLPGYDALIDPPPSVRLNPAGSDDNIRDGAMVIRGLPGLENDIRSVSILSTDQNNAKPSPNLFNTNLNFTSLRKASDPLIGACELDVFDAAGKAHRVTLRFTPTNSPGRWEWEAKTEGMENRIGRGQGTLLFGADGSLSQTTRGLLSLEPENGATRAMIEIELGGPGDFTGLTHFRGATTIAVTSQDGFAPGRLEAVSISEKGIASGAYSNGMSRPLFQLPLADFPNPRGLRPVGENSFLESPESGKPSVSWDLEPAGGSIRSGAVEYLSDAEREKVCGLHPGC